MQDNIILFSEKCQGVFIRAGTFLSKTQKDCLNARTAKDLTHTHKKTKTKKPHLIVTDTIRFSISSFWREPLRHPRTLRSKVKSVAKLQGFTHQFDSLLFADTLDSCYVNLPIQ